MHCFTTGALAAMFYLLLLHTSLLGPQRHRHRASITLFTVLLGLSAGVLWEFYEWFAEVVAGVDFGVGYDDTIADLAMDGLGSLLAGLTLTTWIAMDTSGQRERFVDQDTRDHHGEAPCPASTE